MRLFSPIALLISLSCVAPATTPEPAGAPPINATCPRSGKPVAEDSLTVYRGHTVGFCNPHCRDDFAAHVDERPEDTAVFDAILAELEGGRG